MMLDTLLLILIPALIINIIVYFVEDKKMIIKFYKFKRNKKK